MIKFILRKTAFKQYDKETQDHLIQFWQANYVILWLSYLIFHFIAFVAPIILLQISVRGEKEIDVPLAVGMIIYDIIFLVFYAYFHKEIINFSTNTLGDKLYNGIYARKGKALSKKDFRKIKNIDIELYNLITSTRCHGKCYDVTFQLLRILGTGNIKFIAAKNILKEEPYTLHAVYEKNGWIFDTYNQRQYPVEKCIALHKAIVYKTFSYKDLATLTDREFVNLHYEELAKWCKEHNCSQQFLNK